MSTQRGGAVTSDGVEIAPDVETHDGEGHFLHLLQPDRFVERLQRFLLRRGLAPT